ncbi:hypothetical protein BS47DRAFT_1335060 [Hydnum rufescens UP504]|uniref:CUE domain-containing protein n=1 Tax=Hydnum rufescens UP504 TaxID=1448309 RepID=A0A9P6E2F7_9AGAM|nr:hypothetical protein BS47DRAFT_1335060 [Hydnum rufescens UP504]
MHPGENTIAPTPPIEQAAIPDPRIVPLLAIFPTFDHAILADVLDSCNGNEEKAVDILLGMTDPDHIPQTNVQDISQTERDELLAHRLMIEEQESNSSRPHTQPNNLPYVPRTRVPRKSRGHPAPSDPTVQDNFKDSRKQNAKSGPNSTPGGGGSDFQDQFNKIADTGRKTFNNIFSKVKAKIAESSSSNQQPQASQYDVAGPESTYERSGEGNGYDVTPKMPHNSSPPAAANVDRSKLGLLPKRPVSLGSSPPPSEAAHARNVDDDLYVDNPFEHHQ